MTAKLTILACDTTQQACSVALHHADAGQIKKYHIYEELVVGKTGRANGADATGKPRGHAELLPVMLADILAQAAIQTTQIDRLGVTIGPGTFAGVRIGLAAMQALSLTCPATIYGVNALLLMAAGLQQISRTPSSDPRQAELPIAAVIYARREQFYTQLFAADMTALTPPQIQQADKFLSFLHAHLPRQPVRLIGTGASMVADMAARHRPSSDIDIAPALHLPPDGHAPYPDAQYMPPLIAAMASPPEIAEPLYLRPPDAKLPEKTAETQF